MLKRKAEQGEAIIEEDEITDLSKETIAHVYEKVTQQPENPDDDHPSKP